MPTDTIEYEVFLVKYDEPKENAVSQGITGQLEFVVTIDEEGRYFVGVRVLRTPAGETEVLFSEVTAWSDVLEYCENGETFGIKFYFAPANTGGLAPR